MDFLLECIGFPPTYDLRTLARILREHGEPVPWRGPAGTHLRFPLAAGVEVRLDREEGQDHDTIWPHFEVPRRLRVAVESSARVPDSPYDVLLRGLANPPPPVDGTGPPLEEDPPYPLATFLTDARRVPRDLVRGHVLAVSVSGFALDVAYVGPNEGGSDPTVLESPHGARLAPLVGREEPGGCMDLSLRIRNVRRAVNPLTGIDFLRLEADAPGRPLDLFVSLWQLHEDGLDLPRPGWRVEGSFLFTGRVAGGLPGRHRRPRPVGA